MIILENSTNIQQVFIPRNDSSSGNSKSAYERGYEDGYEEGAGQSVKLQTKSIVITDMPNVTVKPDSGYNGMSSVYIDAEPYAQKAKEEQLEKRSIIQITENGAYTPDSGNYGFKEVYVNVPDNGYSSGYTSGYTNGYASGVTDGKSEQAIEDASKLSEIEINTNGTYDAPYGYKKVIVSTDTSAAYNQGYEAGERDGEATGKYLQQEADKAKLNSIEISGNGTYNAAYGFSSVTVNVQNEELYDEGYTSGYTDGYSSGSTDGYASGKTDGYESGKTDGYSSGYTSGKTDGYNSGYTVGHSEGENAGKAEQRIEDNSKLTSIEITDNGTYKAPYGYSAVTVNVDKGESYNEGYESGKTEQEAIDTAKLSGITITENGTYNADYGFSAVTVNVDQTEGYNSGYTKGYSSGSTDGYNSGYTSGKTDGYASGKTVGYSSGLTEGKAEQKAEDDSKLETITISSDGTYNADYGYSTVIVDRNSELSADIFYETSASTTLFENAVASYSALYKGYVAHLNSSGSPIETTNELIVYIEEGTYEKNGVTITKSNTAFYGKDWFDVTKETVKTYYCNGLERRFIKLTAKLNIAGTGPFGQFGAYQDITYSDGTDAKTVRYIAYVQFNQ